MSTSCYAAKVWRFCREEAGSRKYQIPASVHFVNTTSSWSAISRGAVLHGLTKKKFGSPLKVTVKSRIARESLGVVGEELYDEDVHPAEDKSFDHFLRQDVATKVMKWHVVTVSSDGIPMKNAHCLTEVSTDDRVTKSQSITPFQSSSPNFLTKYPKRSSPTFTSLSMTNPPTARMSPSRRLLKSHGKFRLTGRLSKLSKTTWESASRSWSTLLR